MSDAANRRRLIKHRGKLMGLLRLRRAAFWPPAPPFDDKDVVICFRTTEDAAAFSEALAFDQTEGERIERWRQADWDENQGAEH